MRKLLIALFVALLPAGGVAFAQAPALPAPTAATRFIDSLMLGSKPPSGIPEFAAKVAQLELEFRQANREIQMLGSSIQGTQEKQAQAERAGDKAGAATMMTEVQNLMRQHQEKRARGQQLYANRQRELLGPMLEKIKAAAIRYAQAKAIADLRFADNYKQRDQIKLAGGSDVTADFVAWYAQNVK